MSLQMDLASYYRSKGLSIVPVKLDGSKSPDVTRWKPYQAQIATETVVTNWYSGDAPPGIAIIAGSVSENLEVLDFDEAAMYDHFSSYVRDMGLEDILVSLPLVATPAGMHLYYKVEKSVAVPGNTKLAVRPKIGDDLTTAALQTLIETRGEGGYVLAPGCPAECHPSGGTYRLLRGDLGDIPVITEEDWYTLRSVAMGLSEDSPEQAPPAPVGGPLPKPDESAFGLKRPGDDYALRGNYEEVLASRGWTRITSRGDITHWRRPGKSSGGLSATSNYQQSGLFYVFSSNAYPFEAGKSYTPMAVYAILEHSGDYSAAAKALADAGYGDPPTRPGVKMTNSQGGSATDALGTAARDTESREELDIANRWADLYRKEFVFVEGAQWWRCQDGRIWKYSSSEVATSKVQKFLSECRLSGESVKVTPTKIRNVLFLAQSLVGPLPAKRFDSHLNWIPLQNGIYDMETDRLFDHSPDNWISRLSPFSFDPEAECPRWQRFLSEVLIEQGGKPCIEWVDALQLWFGYCLIADTTLQTSMVWVGEGRNGKGVATRVLTKLVGQRSVTSIPIEQLHDPYHRADLHGKLVGLVNEPDPKAMAKNGNWFKAIVGGDEISARRPTEKVFSFVPTTRLIISCNEMPRTRDLSKGYFQRIVPIEWRYNVPAEKRDRTLDQALEDEMPGIFNWALAGLKRVMADKTLRIMPEASQKLLEDYQTGEDGIGRFVAESLVITNDLSDRLPAKELYQQYIRWCEDNGELKYSSRALGLRLRKMGLENPNLPTRKDDGTREAVRYWRPVKSLKEAEQEGLPDI